MSISVMQMLAGAFVVWFGWAVLQPLKRWKYRHIPGPIGWPLVGNLYNIIKKGQPVHLRELEAQYGPVFKFWFGGDVWVVLTDPDVVRRLCLRYNTRPSNDILNVLPHKELDLINLGLAATNDMDLWRIARKAYDSSLLVPASLAQYTPTMDKCSLRLINRLKQFAASGETVDMWPELGTMTLEVVGECAYGIDFHSVADGRECSEQQQVLGQQLVEACRIVFKQGAVSEASLYVPVQLLFPILSPLIRKTAEMFPDARYIKSVEALRLIRRVSGDLLADWKASHFTDGRTNSAGLSFPASADNTTHAGTVTTQLSVSDRSFLSSMMVGRDQQQTSESTQGGTEARRGGGGKKHDSDAEDETYEMKHFLNDPEVVAQALTFILAGYETTANILAFVIYLLSANPAAEARVLKEVDAFGRSQAILPSHLDQFPYLDAFVKESLRVCSPASHLTRMGTDEFHAHGKTIPKGSKLWFPIHSFHTSGNFWPRADEFLPERFLPEGQAILGPTTVNAAMPFGAGGRMCPGWKFSQQEAKISLVRLYQNFTFRLKPGMPPFPRVKTATTTGPAEGVPVVVHSRVD